MTAPAPITGYTLTQAATGDPSVTLAYTQSATNLDRFQVMSRLIGDATWTSETVNVASDFLVSGTSYSATLASQPGYEWIVRGLSSTGEPAVSNPRQTFAGQVEGVWLIPHNNGKVDSSFKVFVGSEPIGWGRVFPGEVTFALNRAEGVSTRTKLQLRSATLSGPLLNRNGQTAKTWLRRLSDLIDRQHRFNVFAVDSQNRVKVEISDWSSSFVQMGGPAWQVDITLRELD